MSRPLIKEKLKQGVTLVVDRYAFSGVAFTSAKEVSEQKANSFCLSVMVFTTVQGVEIVLCSLGYPYGDRQFEAQKFVSLGLNKVTD